MACEAMIEYITSVPLSLLSVLELIFSNSSTKFIGIYLLLKSSPITPNSTAFDISLFT
nr:MAG TPA: hypothetical protein [Bacteriophage sp.]